MKNESIDIISINTEKTSSTLLLVDLQKGFINGRSKQIVPKIISLVKSGKYGRIYATQFFNTPESPFVKFLNWKGCMDSPETDLIDELDKYTFKVIKKYTYSALNEELLCELRNNNITEIDIAGVDTDACVLATAYALFDAGIRPNILSSYCASSGYDDVHKAALRVAERNLIFRGAIK